MRTATRPATLRFVDVSKGWIERRSNDEIFVYNIEHNRRKSRPILSVMSNQEEHDLPCPIESFSDVKKDNVPNVSQDSSKRKSIAAITIPPNLISPVAVVSPSNALNNSDDGDEDDNEITQSHCFRYCICCCPCRFLRYIFKKKIHE